MKRPFRFRKPYLLRLTVIVLVACALIYFYSPTVQTYEYVILKPRNDGPMPLPQKTEKPDTVTARKNGPYSFVQQDATVSSSAVVRGSFYLQRWGDHLKAFSQYSFRDTLGEKGRQAYIDSFSRLSYEKRPPMPNSSVPDVTIFQPEIDPATHVHKLVVRYISNLEITAAYYFLGPDQKVLRTWDDIKGGNVAYSLLSFEKSRLKVHGRILNFASCRFLNENDINLIADDHLEFWAEKIGPDNAVSLQASSVNMGNSKLDQYSSLNINASEINLIEGNIIAGHMTIASPIVKNKSRALSRVHIKDGALKHATIAVAHMLVKLDNIELDSVSVLTAGDTIILNRLTGTGKLQLRDTAYKDRWLNINDKLVKQSAVCLLKDVDTARIILPATGIDFLVDDGLTPPQQDLLYRYLIGHYQNDPEEKQRYDLAYQRFQDRANNHWLSGFIKDNWNEYGYKKDLIFWNSLFISLFFFALNLISYPYINWKGYYFEEFRQSEIRIRKRYPNRWLAELRITWDCLLYTLFLFWGLKLDISKIKISNIGYTLLVLTQYVAGLICLAYIVNIVITK